MVVEKAGIAACLPVASAACSTLSLIPSSCPPNSAPLMHLAVHLVGRGQRSTYFWVPRFTCLLLFLPSLYTDGYIEFK